MTLGVRTQPRSRVPEDGPSADVEALVAELRRRSFDLRRAVFLTYLLELGADRDSAFAVRDRAAAAGWQATLFGDETGWVVRLGRLGLARTDLLQQNACYVQGLADACGGSLRGVCVEDLRRGDLAEALADTSAEAGRPAAELVPRVPAPRRPAPEPSCRPARSA